MSTNVPYKPTLFFFGKMCNASKNWVNVCGYGFLFFSSGEDIWVQERWMVRRDPALSRALGERRRASTSKCRWWGGKREMWLCSQRWTKSIKGKMARMVYTLLLVCPSGMGVEKVLREEWAASLSRHHRRCLRIPKKFLGFFVSRRVVSNRTGCIRAPVFLYPKTSLNCFISGIMVLQRSHTVSTLDRIIV